MFVLLVTRVPGLCTSVSAASIVTDSDCAAGGTIKRNVLSLPCPVELTCPLPLPSGRFLLNYNDNLYYLLSVNCARAMPLVLGCMVGGAC